MWKSDEVKKLMEYKDKKTPKEIAEMIGKTERAVKLYMYRQNISGRKKLKCPLVEKMLNLKFGNAKFFTPDREWFKQVGISQKRFAELKQGYAQPNTTELKSIAKGIHLNIDEMCEFFKVRQLELFN